MHGAAVRVLQRAPISAPTHHLEDANLWDILLVLLNIHVPVYSAYCLLDLPTFGTNGDGCRSMREARPGSTRRRGCRSAGPRPRACYGSPGPCTGGQTSPASRSTPRGVSCLRTQILKRYQLNSIEQFMYLGSTVQQ